MPLEELVVLLAPEDLLPSEGDFFVDFAEEGPAVDGEQEVDGLGVGLYVLRLEELLAGEPDQDLQELVADESPLRVPRRLFALVGLGGEELDFDIGRSEVLVQELALADELLQPQRLDAPGILDRIQRTVVLVSLEDQLVMATQDPLALRQVLLLRDDPPDIAARPIQFEAVVEDRFLRNPADEHRIRELPFFFSVLPGSERGLRACFDVVLQLVVIVQQLLFLYLDAVDKLVGGLDPLGGVLRVDCYLGLVHRPEELACPRGHHDRALAFGAALVEAPKVAPLPIEVEVNKQIPPFHAVRVVLRPIEFLRRPPLADPTAILLCLLMITAGRPHSINPVNYYRLVALRRVLIDY